MLLFPKRNYKHRDQKVSNLYFMTILHICNSYGYNTLYRNLTLKISQLNIKQIVFVPIRKQLKLKENVIDNENIEIFYSNPVNIFDRIFFFKKTKKLYKNILST